MAAISGEHQTTDDDIVHVPVPKHLLATVYRALADAMASDGDTAAESSVGGRSMIDLIVEAAQHIGADERLVSLTDLYNSYR